LHASNTPLNSLMLLNPAYFLQCTIHCVLPIEKDSYVIEKDLYIRIQC
jgi:hypothetical protein